MAGGPLSGEDLANLFPALDELPPGRVVFRFFVQSDEGMTDDGLEEIAGLREYFADYSFYGRPTDPEEWQGRDLIEFIVLDESAEDDA